VRHHYRHGPVLENGGVRFRLWAPSQASVELLLDDAPRQMAPAADGFFELFVEGAGAGARYRFRLSGGAVVPDPASRFQPRDADGPSEIIDHDSYVWRENWRGLSWSDAVLYELHVGAFTAAGDFHAAADRLGHLAQLGVTAIEVMPVGDFHGKWNWGYDGVLPYAPDSSYGRPEDFKAFVEAAHALGIAVLLDVVYNHFGPADNYLSLYAPDFFTERHKTPWGPAINFDGPRSQPVRDFFIDNARYWIEEFHLDGLRLDAVHAIQDDSARHVLRELAETVRAGAARPVHLLLENEENDPAWLTRQGRQPILYTAQWNDDLHHVLHVAATREGFGYYADYLDNTELLGRALAEGFAFQGQTMAFRGAARGGPSGRLPPETFVAFIQNHDQVGNRALGERISTLSAPQAARALSAVCLLLPQTPMIFMGEEWGARQPFLFFCDFEGALADAVRDGRRAEFARFPAFSDSAQRALIPDPLARSTFEASKLDWNGVDQDHLARYRALLDARRRWVRPMLPDIAIGGEASALGEGAVRIRWRANERRLVLDANLSDQPVEYPDARGQIFWSEGEAGRVLGSWSIRWSIEEAR
jgi:maltooligosyltrehalose trehalohydrolase